jgi:hypothetical protein
MNRRRKPLYAVGLFGQPAPILTAFGLPGLFDSLPRLEPGRYWINDVAAGGHWGDADVLESSWSLKADSGMAAGPGFIIV